MPRTRQAMKQRRPAATDDGMNDDAVLVDEPELRELCEDIVETQVQEIELMKSKL